MTKKTEYCSRITVNETLNMAFIVIEGLDGSGKSTQMKMLRDYFSGKKIDFEYLHFPRMEAPVFGELVARFLRGELGKIDEVDPYIVALLYAGDRKAAAVEIQTWLDNGKLVLLDRYVYSNIAYQCAKIDDSQGKEKLRDWILNMEYNYFGIPVPDINIYLDAPFDFVKKNLESQRHGDDRDYLKGSIDIHEASMNFQEKVRQVYLSLEGKEKNYSIIKCYNEKQEMLKAEEVFEKILGKIK